MRRPTSDEATANARIDWNRNGELRSGIACWYPQMGGYGALCIIEPIRGGCFEAYVWHDGEFPFETGNPRKLHHCLPEQFTKFGEVAVRAYATLGIERPTSNDGPYCVFCGERISGGKESTMVQAVYDGVHAERGYILKRAGRAIHFHGVCGVPES